MPLIRLTIPGTLDYRDLAVRVVAAACKLVRQNDENGENGENKENNGVSEEARSEFDMHVVSAFGEAFNNVAIHSYKGRPVGSLDIEIDVGVGEITLRIADHGPGYDPLDVKEPDLDELPESGMGLFIMREFMDSVSYQAGAPNVLSMSKKLSEQTSGGVA